MGVCPELIRLLIIDVIPSISNRLLSMNGGFWAVPPRLGSVVRWSPGPIWERSESVSILVTGFSIPISLMLPAVHSHARLSKESGARLRDNSIPAASSI